MLATTTCLSLSYARNKRRYGLCARQNWKNGHQLWLGCQLVCGPQQRNFSGRERRRCNDIGVFSVGEVDAAETDEVLQDESREETLGEMRYKEPTSNEKFFTSLRLIFALPWRRFKNGSALTMKLSGKIAEQPQSRFSSTLSLPDICGSLYKAAYDPRVKGVVVKIDPLDCGWAKLQEIRRHVEFFRESGKFAMAYLERAGEKEYYLASAFEEVYAPPSASVSLRGLSVNGTFLRGVLDKVGVEPEVRRIGKYKSAGDQLLREDMSEAQREQLSTLLDDIYEDFVSGIAHGRGKTKEEVEDFINEGVYDMKVLQEGNWVTNLKYEDEINDILKERTGGKEDELRFVKLKRYSKVSPSAFGLFGGKTIAVVRTSGAILGGSGASGAITAESVIAQLRSLKKNKKVAAVVLRVDSPGGDALASDLMWREAKKFAEEKPLIASMADVAASGGYYLSMGCQKIVAEGLTLTGSIGVVTGKFSLEQLYEKIGYRKETISRGRYAQILNESRSFNEDEAALFDKAAEFAYEQFRDKAAESRDMSIDEMQEVAQGRVWSGKRAHSVGLVDHIGGLWKAVQLAREAAGIKEEEKVTIREVSRAKASPLSLLSGGVSATVLQGMIALVFSSLSGQKAVSTLSQTVGIAALINEVDISDDDLELAQGLQQGQVMAQFPTISVDGSFRKNLPFSNESNSDGSIF